MWEHLLVVFGGNAALLLVLGFLFRSLLSQWLAKDVESFKAKLKADADTSIEQLKTTLQMTALEHEVRFSKLHEKRAQVIADLYERFVKAYWAAWTYHQWMERPGGQTQEQQADSAMHKLHEAFVFFEINRIYLSDPLAGSLDVFFEKAKILTLKAQYFDAIPNKTEHTAQLHFKAKQEGLESFQNEFPAMRQRLDTEFAKLLEPRQGKD